VTDKLATKNGYQSDSDRDLEKEESENLLTHLINSRWVFINILNNFPMRNTPNCLSFGIAIMSFFFASRET
jgi:hypothetical protein